MKQNIGVLFGGKSPEHDISIITAMQVIANLNTYLYNIIPLYMDKSGRITTSTNYYNLQDFKCVKKAKKVLFECGNSSILIKKFLGYVKVQLHACVVCNHGQNGEDGALSGMLNLLNIPYTCPDIIGSSVGCDKVIFKDVLKSLDINYVPYVELQEEEYINNKEYVINNSIKQLQFPLIIKPARLGSSIGINICKNVENIEECINNSLLFDNKLLLEKFLDIEKEVNFALFINNDLVKSNIEQPLTHDEILTFSNKYLTNNSKGMQGAKRTTPKLTRIQKEYIIESAIKLYRHLELKGVVRFDFIIADKVYLNEINTIPGSMANYLFEGRSFSNQLTEQIRYCINEKSRRDSKINYFNSSVLDEKFEIIKK